MLSRRLSRLLNKLSSTRNIHSSRCNRKEFENPILRTLRILKDDFMLLKGPKASDLEKQRALTGQFPRHTDILVVGGGAIGSSIAYWLKEKTGPEGIRVIVLEKDITYSKCSTVLSAGSLHQQYSLPENIQMSLFGATFLRTIKKRFGDGVDVSFTPHGYLVLADEQNAQRLIDNSKMEKEFGVVSRLLTKDQIKQKFPWMNVNDIELGSFGLENHGWFDPWALLSLMRYGATDMGTQYINAELVDFMFCERQDVVMEGMDDSAYHSCNEAVIKMPDGEHRTMEFAYCIIAAGIDTPEVASLARIGCGTGMLSVPLPIQTKSRYIYKFDCGDSPPGLNTPMTIDPSGIYFRRHGLGGSFLAGISPMEKPDVSNEELFEQDLTPVLRQRVPAFKNVKMTNSWSGVYDYNQYDDSGIVGPHPYYYNLYLATGFSPYGIQQAPAIGRAVAEMILDGNFQTIDLSRFGFDRFIVEKPIYEFGVI